MRRWISRLIALRKSGAAPVREGLSSDELAGQVRDLELLHAATLRVTRTRDWNQALREILQAAIAAIPAERGILSLVHEDGKGLRPAVALGFSDEFLELLPFMPGKRGACGAAFKSRGRILVHDASHDPVFFGLQEYVRAGAFRSVHSVPLVGRDGDVLGSLSLYFRRLHAPDQRELRLLDLYAQMAVEFIERWQGEKALRTSERQKQQLLSVMPAGVYTCDLDGKITFFNEAAEKIWGRRPHDGVDRWCGALRMFKTDGSPLSHDDCLTANAARLGHNDRDEEITIDRPDGSRRIVLPSPQPIRDAAGQMVGVMNIMLDVTERKLAERAQRESDAQLKQMVSLIPVGVFALNAEGRLTFFNRCAGEFWGWNPVLGESVDQVLRRYRAYWSDGRPIGDGESPIGRALRRGEASRDVEFVLEAVETGRRSTLVQSVDLLRDESGAVTSISCVFHDITARRRSENELRESEARHRAVTDTAPVMLMRCDLDQRLVFANRAYLRRRGVAAGDFIGRNFADIVGAAAYEELKPYIARVLSGEMVQFETTLDYGREIGRRDLAVCYVPERAHDGRVCGWIGAITDVTELKRADAVSRQLAAIVESSGDAIIGLDLDGVITSWNTGAEYLFGYTAAETCGQPVGMLLPTERSDEGPAFLARIRSGERIDHFQTVRLRKDGREARISLTISPIKDAAGTIIGASKIARDITDLYAAQEALQQRTQLLEAINRVSGAFVAELNLERIVARVIEVAREISGAEVAAFYERAPSGMGMLMNSVAVAGGTLSVPETIGIFHVGAGGLIRVQPPHSVELLEADAHWLAVPVIARSGGVLGGMLFGRKDGGGFTDEVERILSAVAAQAALAIDNAKLYHAVEHELREKRRAEADLLAAQTQLKAHAALLEQKVQERTVSLREAITQMEEFSYTVSHDLRAPLRAMNTYAQALLEDYTPQLDATGRHYVERIQRSSQHMEKLTHDVLTYSRLARAEIQLTAVDLDALLSDMIYQYAEFQPPHVDIKISRPLHDVRGHEVSLGQCIANLLTNAVKFVAPGVQPRIRLHTELRGEMVRLWIVDNGIGIEPQYQQRLFQVFERLHTRQRYEGTGIGLAIVRKAVDKMGGRCGVESDGVNGSRFWIELPSAPPIAP